MKTLNELNESELNAIANMAIEKSEFSEDYLEQILDYTNAQMENLELNVLETKLNESFETALEQASALFDQEIEFKLESFRGFWTSFKTKAQKVICKEKVIVDFFTGEGSYTLKDALKYIIPIVIGALGLSAINPLTLAIIIGVLALIAKIGFKAYCELN
jgi:DNA-binding FrmR family transcriptional regulator